MPRCCTVRDEAALLGCLRGPGYALLEPAALLELLPLARADLEVLTPSWEHLPRDVHLRDGGTYRYRRHASFVLESDSGTLRQAPHRAHWQPTDYNALHGGLLRWFEPIAPAVAEAPGFRSLLTALGRVFGTVRAAPSWFIEAHQFRIDAAEGIGRPTPEGAHRDGVDFVAVLLVRRGSVRGGETRVFDAHGPSGIRFTMSEPWAALLLDDARVIHETTPIQPDGAPAVRDTLVLTYRAAGFLSPDASPA